MSSPPRFFVQTFTREVDGVEAGRRVPADTAAQARLIARALLPSIVGAAVVEVEGSDERPNERVVAVAGDLPPDYRRH